jgi:hypothetical protein
MYLRFVVAEINRASERELGVFQAVYNLRDDGKLYSYEESHLDELRQWFDIHLKEPTRFTTASPSLCRKKNRAICWFKASAKEHITRIHEMVAILENHGITVQMIKTERVGYVVYEDEHQVVAEPFSDTLT